MVIYCGVSLYENKFKSVISHVFITSLAMFGDTGLY